MLRTMLTRFGLAVLLLGVCCAGAWARGEERYGNEPLHEGNYTEWPGIMPVVNHPSRVYRSWVNGNEHFYYRGDTAALNEILRKFAAVKGDVVLRPGPGEAGTFDPSRKIPFTWRLQLIGGIARHLLTLEGAAKVWNPQPELSIYAGGDIDLDKLVIPRELAVLSLADVKKRVREGLKSSDKTVRGWTNGALAELDPYDAESRDAIAAMLKDKDNWVRLNAAGALGKFGKTAQPALPLLRSALETDDAPLKTGVQKGIQDIEQAADRTAAEQAHREMLARIDRYLAARKG
jgi:hypothetical protein